MLFFKECFCYTALRLVLQNLRANIITSDLFGPVSIMQDLPVLMTISTDTSNTQPLSSGFTSCFLEGGLTLSSKAELNLGAGLAEAHYESSFPCWVRLTSLECQRGLCSSFSFFPLFGTFSITNNLRLSCF